MSGISIGQILQAEMDKRGLNQHSLALEAGLKPDAVRDILRGRSQSPRGATIKKLAAYLGMSVGQLLGVDGVTTGDRGLSLPTGGGKTTSYAETIVRAVQPSREINELDAEPQGGNGAVLPDMDGPDRHPVIAKWSMPEDFLRANTTAHGKLVIIRVSGDSMEPDYPAGERILVDTAHQIPSPPGVYVLWDGFGLVLKRVEILLGSDPPRVKIKSINPAYDTYERALDEVIINGRVVGKWVWK